MQDEPETRSPQNTIRTPEAGITAKSPTFLALALLTVACSDRKDITVSAWFEIQAKQPVRAGIFAWGPGPSQSFRVRTRWGWKEVARGGAGSVMRLQRDPAVLFC